MFNPFAFIREKARESVLAGIHDALVQIDASANQTPPTVTTVPTPALSAGPSPAASDSDMDTSGDSPEESLQERLARAAEAGNPPQLPPAPSAPIRGRGRPPKGDKP